MHKTCEPAILYFGTPVVLISTQNEDGSCNLAPFSSVFWLGWRCIIGLGTTSKTMENLVRTRECVVNLPSVNEAAAVNRLALTTGSNPVPPRKARRGYRFYPNKFEIAGFTPVPSQIVAVPAVKECPVHLEAIVTATNGIGEDDEALQGRMASVELKVLRVHIEQSIMVDGTSSHVDPDKWRPLIMSFQQFYGLGDRVHDSKLAEIPEALYKSDDHKLLSVSIHKTV
jgi:flavin reductase (DIM6/NTAB) family NADH-FMN oxidoreductase RutF